MLLESSAISHWRDGQTYQHIHVHVSGRNRASGLIPECMSTHFRSEQGGKVHHTRVEEDQCAIGQNGLQVDSATLGGATSLFSSQQLATVNPATSQIDFGCLWFSFHRRSHEPTWGLDRIAVFVPRELETSTHALTIMHLVKMMRVMEGASGTHTHSGVIAELPMSEMNAKVTEGSSEIEAEGIGKDTSDLTHRKLQRQRELYKADVEVLTAKRCLKEWTHTLMGYPTSHSDFCYLDAERIYQTLDAEGAWMEFVRFPDLLSVHNELRLKQRVASLWPEVLLIIPSTSVDYFEGDASEVGDGGILDIEPVINMLFDSKMEAIEQELPSVEDIVGGLHGRDIMYLNTDGGYSLSQRNPQLKDDIPRVGKRLQDLQYSHPT